MITDTRHNVSVVMKIQTRKDSKLTLS